MRVKKPKTMFAPHEIQRFIFPVTIAFICLITGLLLEHILKNEQIDPALIIYGTSAILYCLINNVLIVRTYNYQETYGLINAIFSGIWLGLFTYMAPRDVQETAHVLILLGIIAVGTVSRPRLDREPKDPSGGSRPRLRPPSGGGGGDRR